MTEEIEAPHVHEDVSEDIRKAPGPVVEYSASFSTKKGQRIVIDDVRGFQFDGGFYFLFVIVDEMPVPEVHVLDLSSPDVVGLKVTPVRVHYPDA